MKNNRLYLFLKRIFENKDKQIRDLINRYPNDMDLGSKIRELYKC